MGPNRGLLLPHLLPHSVCGIFFSYIDHKRTHLFAHLSPALSTGPKIDAVLSFLPSFKGGIWSMMDQCDNLGHSLRHGPTMHSYSGERCFPVHEEGVFSATPGAYIMFDLAVSPHYDVVLILVMVEEPARLDRWGGEEEAARKHHCWLLPP
nr:unnamed protein product [Digitaria exilis]